MCLILAARAPAFGKYAYAIANLGRNPVFADDAPLVAKTASFPLNNKAPQRVACILNEPCQNLLRRQRLAREDSLGTAVACVMCRQVPQSRFQRPAKAAKRGRLLLDSLVGDRVFAGVAVVGLEWSQGHGGKVSGRGSFVIGRRG